MRLSYRYPKLSALFIFNLFKIKIKIGTACVLNNREDNLAEVNTASWKKITPQEFSYFLIIPSARPIWTSMWLCLRHPQTRQQHTAGVWSANHLSEIWIRNIFLSISTWIRRDLRILLNPVTNFRMFQHIHWAEIDANRVQHPNSLHWKTTLRLLRGTLHV